jgi:hypothetical protein
MIAARALACSLAVAGLAMSAACARTPEPVSAPTTAAPVPANRPSVASAPANLPAPATTSSAAAVPALPVVAAEVDTTTSAMTPVDASLPLVIVHKNPSCGCCVAWVEHMQRSGFVVEVRNVDNLDPVKTRVGVPAGKGSCHTAEVGGYFVEGHVPADDVKRLLTERPDAKGLTVPGMPMGSPGMEVPDGRVQAYTVDLVGRDGATSTYAQHGDG